MSNERLLFIKEVNKVFQKAYEEVKRIRKITDDKKRAEEASEARNKLNSRWNNKIMTSFQQYCEEGDLGVWQDVSQGFADITQEKYEGLNSPDGLLLDIWSEAEAKVKNKSKLKPQTNYQPIQQKQPNQQSQKTDKWVCASCHETKTEEYYYRNKTDDGKRFCSRKCHLEFYGKTCNVCKNKFLDFEEEDGLIYCVPCLKDYLNKENDKLKKENKLTKRSKN